MDYDSLNYIRPMTLIKARTTKDINSVAVPFIPKGTDVTVHLIMPLKGYSLCHGLVIFAIWNHEYELLERPKHQCTNLRCGNLFTLLPGHDRCPTCQHPIKEVPLKEVPSGNQDQPASRA